MLPINPRDYLMTFSEHYLILMASNAVKEYDLDSGWIPKIASTKIELVDLIDELCEFHSITPVITGMGLPKLTRYDPA